MFIDVTGIARRVRVVARIKLPVAGGQPAKLWKQEMQIRPDLPSPQQCAGCGAVAHQMGLALAEAEANPRGGRRPASRPGPPGTVLEGARAIHRWKFLWKLCPVPAAHPLYTRFMVVSGASGPEPTVRPTMRLDLSGSGKYILTRNP